MNMATKMLLPGYDVGKAAQATAFFALKSGGSINVLKLSKLLYLAEREFMARYDTPMFYDDLFSLPDGPVASVTLNLINGEVEHDLWSRFVSCRSGYDIAVAAGVSENMFDHLSKADMEVLTDLWSRFGTYDRFALRDWTHERQNVPEWRDPQGSSCRIKHEDVFRLLGKSEAIELAYGVEAYRQMQKYLAAAE
jgi:uncharacterized phage-associated protein